MHVLLPAGWGSASSFVARFCGVSLPAGKPLLTPSAQRVPAGFGAYPDGRVWKLQPMSPIMHGVVDGSPNLTASAVHR